MKEPDKDKDTRAYNWIEYGVVWGGGKPTQFYCGAEEKERAMSGLPVKDEEDNTTPPR